MKGFVTTIVLSAALILFSSLSADRSKFYGYWIGTIRVMENEIEIRVGISKSGGILSGTIEIPEQLPQELTLTGLEIAYPEISFSLEVGAPAHFKGSMKEGYISGTFSQAGVNGLFHLVQGERKNKSELQVEKLPLEGEVELLLETGAGELSGSLVLPIREENYPLVIIIAGSGPTDRDGNNPLIAGKGYVYRQIAEELREAGIASLRYDKRGVGKSVQAMIKEEDLRIAHLAEDVAAWIKLMKNDSRFDKIVLLGHSQGSLLAILAAQEERVDGLISAAGAGRNMADLLLEQFSRQPEPYRSEAENIIRALQREERIEQVSEELSVLFRPSLQSFLQSAFRYDPAVEIGNLDIPLLIIQGTTDLQVAVEDADRLGKGNEKAEVLIIEGMNHMFRTAPDELRANFSTYGDPELPLATGFIAGVIRFISEL
jgi:hypothetical protein